jgi:hypothetical protein
MSRQRSAIEWQDIVAATFVVGPDLIEADFLTLPEAVLNLPTIGGSIFVLQGSYTSSSAVTLPVDKDVTISFASGAVMNFGSTVAVAFTFPNGLSERRHYIINNPQYVFSATAGQDFIKISDAGGYVAVDVYNCDIYHPAKLVNFTAYDTAYLSANSVHFHGGSADPLDGVSVLVAAPAVAGTYGGPAWVGFTDTDLNPAIPYTYWLLDADADILYSSLSSESFVSIAGGSAIDGFDFHGAFLHIGNGDFSIIGVSFAGGSAIIAATMGGAGVNARILCADSGSVVQGYVSDLCFKFGDAAAPGIPKVQSAALFMSGTAIDMANPAIELVSDGATISDSFFAVRYPAGAIKITNAKFCKIHDNAFATSLTGKTIIESGTSDENDLHDNSGMLNGTGLTIIGPKTKINNSVLADKATSTTNALVEIVPTITNPKGLIGIGWIKNTDGANSLDVKESFTDAFGVTSTLTTTVTFGNSLPLSLQQSIGTGLPPYVSYKAEVIDTVAGSHATYVSHFTSQGSL